MKVRLMQVSYFMMIQYGKGYKDNILLFIMQESRQPTYSRIAQTNITELIDKMKELGVDRS